MGRIIILSFFYAIILVATTSPMETTSTSSDEQPSITFLVQDTEYMLTQEEASQFKTLKNMIEAEALETPQEAIPLPNLITSKTFDYILKDLKEIPYDHQLISDKQLIALINAINYLDNQDLLTLYLNRLADRLSALDSQEKLEYFQRLLNDRLPAEIQDLLSALINQASMKLFKALPQLSVDDKPLVKRVLERESIFYKKMWLSPDKKYIAFLEKFSGIISLVLIDADTNKELWRKKDFNFSSIKFSSDSSQIVLRKGNYLILIDTQTGEILWEKNKKNSFKIMKLTLDNSLIFLLKKGSKKIIIIDAENGLRVGKFLLENFEAVSRCIYDSELGSLIIQGKEKTQDVIFSINIFTQERLKFKKENHLQVSPDGKKIITLTNSNVTIENSFDDENTFTFNFTKRFNHIPLVSFSRDTDFVALLSYNSDETIIILNMENRNSNILPSIKNLAQQLDAFFSPEANF